MEKIQDTLSKKTIVSIVDKNIKNYSYYSPEMNVRQADAIVDQAVDLIDNQKFRPFFFKTLYLIGPTNFYFCMDLARKEVNIKCRPCFFVKLLKEYRDRLTKDSGNNRISVGNN